MDGDAKVVFTTKELLEKIDGKLDRLDGKLDKKADIARVCALIDTLKVQVFAEIARLEALIAPLVDPQTGVYSRIEGTKRELDGKTIAALSAIVLLLAGILFKKYVGLA